MRVFKGAWFEEFARREKISDTALCEAARRVEAVQMDAEVEAGRLIEVKCDAPDL